MTTNSTTSNVLGQPRSEGDTVHETLVLILRELRAGEILDVVLKPEQDGIIAVEAWIKDFLYARSLALTIPPPGPEVVLAIQTFAGDQ